MRCAMGPKTKHVAVNVRLDGVESGPRIRLWSLDDDQQPITSKLLPLAGGIPEFSADERWLVRNGHLLSLMDGDSEYLDYDCDQYAMSPNGELLAIAVGNAVRLWSLSKTNPKESEVVLPLGHEARINHLTFSSDSRWLATASLDASVRVWDTADSSSSQRPLILRGQESTARESRFSGDARWIVTSDNDHARLWRFSNGDLRVSRVLLRGYGETSYALSNDKRWFAVGVKNRVNVYDLTSDKPKESAQVLHGHHAQVESTSFSRDGRFLVSGAADGHVRLWTCDQNGIFAFATAVEHEQGDRLTRVAICPQGRWVVSVGNRGGWVMLHDLSRSSRLRRAIDGNVPDAVQFSSDGRWMISGGYNCIPELWDLSQDLPTETVRRLPGHASGLGAAVFDDDNQRLFTSCARSPSTCFVWNLASKDLATWQDRLEDVADFALSNDRRWLATANTGGLDLYDARLPLHEQTPVRIQQQQPCFTFSSRGHLLAAGSRDRGSRIGVWSITRDAPYKLLDLQFPDPISNMQLSMEGRWLLVGSIDQATLWDIRSPDGPVTLRGGNQL